MAVTVNDDDAMREFERQMAALTAPITPNDGQWVAEGSVGAVALYRRTDRGTAQFDCVRAETVFDAPPADACALVWAFGRQGEFDDMYADARVLEQRGDDCRVEWMGCQPVFPTTGRDLCVIRSRVARDDGSFMTTAVSIDRDDCPPAPPYVRTEVEHSGYRLTPLDGGRRCAVVYIMWMRRDHGWVPNVLLRQGERSVPRRLEGIRRALIPDS